MKKRKTRPEDRGTCQRMEDYRRVYRQTKNHRLAIRAYCLGNKWLEENAKAVGNWPRKGVDY